MVAAATMTGVSLLTLLFRPILIINGRLSVANASTWANPLLYLLLLVAALAVSPATAQTAALCQFAAGVVIACWLGFQLRSIFRPTLHRVREEIRLLVSYTARIAPGEMLTVATGNLDRLVLVAMIPAAQLGRYAIAYSLSRVLMILQSTLTSVVLPALTNARPEDRKGLHDRIFRCTLYAVSAVSLVVIGLGGWVIEFLYGRDFAGAGPLLSILTIEAAISSVGFLPTQLFMTYRKPGYLSVVQIASFVVAAVAFAVLVPRLGALGAAITIAVAALFRLLALLVGFRPILGLSPPDLRPRMEDVHRIREAFRR
jgi:O-antigen/teichoic acid export membrane protein